MRNVVRLFFLVFLIMGLAFAPVNPNEQDLLKLQGEWTIVTYTLGGNPPSSVEGMTTIITQNRMQNAKDGMKLSSEWEITLDTTRNPKHINFKGINGPAKGTKALGIYRIEGVNLIISCHKSQRPVNFEGTQRGFTVETYKRCP
jgi:uncharacterized protein (TIGR03067 family)